VQEVIVEGFARFPISIAIVWINMLALDDEAAAASSARLVQDLRARHFHDPHALAGKAIAARLGNPGAIAWDIYLFYRSGLPWQQEPPVPVEWAHQLSDAWADPNHFHWNDELVTELQRVMYQFTL
jgi:hypothetical protein